MSKYKIGEIAVEIRDGKPFYWVYYVGWHPGQGGMEFCEGNLGMEDLDALIKVMQDGLSYAMNDIIKQIEKKK